MHCFTQYWVNLTSMAVSFVIATSICIILLVMVIQRLIERHRIHKIIDQIPGPKAYPILGNLLNFAHVQRDDRFKWFIEFSKEYEAGIFRLWVAGVCSVQLTKAKHLEVILPHSRLITKSRLYYFLHSWLGTGLLTSTGEQWYRQRKLITPTFHFTILEEFSAVMFDKAAILSKCVELQYRKNPTKPIDVFQLGKRCTLDIICESAMGINISAHMNSNEESLLASRSIGALVLERIVQPWLHWDWLYYKTAKGKLYKRLVDRNMKLTNQVIEERRRRRQGRQEIDEDFSDESINRKRKAFLDHLMDASERDKHALTDEELRQEVATFMFAGHDTTAAALGWTLFCVGNNPDVQEKIHEEQILVFGDSKEPASLKQISKLKYLERVIKETLRLFPSVPSVSRSVTEDVTIGDYTIPKGSMITMHINLVHRDPEHWPDPDRFNPDRFLLENSRGRHPYAYVPFSAGPRNCVGQRFAMNELKIILTVFLRKWRVKSLLKPDEIVYLSEFVLTSRDGIMVYLTPK